MKNTLRWIWFADTTSIFSFHYGKISRGELKGVQWSSLCSHRYSKEHSAASPPSAWPLSYTLLPDNADRQRGACLKTQFIFTAWRWEGRQNTYLSFHAGLRLMVEKTSEQPPTATWVGSCVQFLLLTFFRWRALPGWTDCRLSWEWICFSPSTRLSIRPAGTPKTN